ncbi:nucleotidyltransferase [Promicromonospora vindobonensis]|uniref:Nucleotidyltransferase n=1 Tax=Promicromonospora vindobonensis TaxID=195748 RepID=A0ABW5VZU8_9MICO
MTLTTASPFTGRFDQFLEGGLRGLDISPQEHDMVVRRYQGFASVLDATWATTHSANKVFPQGSFALGTVVRNVKRGNNLDIDSVAVRGIAKTSISQQDLKAEVGVAARSFAAAKDDGSPRVTEDSRCWTIEWPTMHMDVLPAVPDPECDEGGVLITDRTVRTWLASNPIGYKDWFHDLMRQEYIEKRAEFEAKELDVDEVPQWQIRTTLQRTVQALKRHRDVYFKSDAGWAPSSVVITTLAARAYRGGGDLNDVLREVTSGMPNYLSCISNQWVLPNPAQADENFAEYWSNADADRFFQWHADVTRTFGGLSSKSGLHASLSEMERAFEWSFAEAASDVGRRLHQAGAAGSLRVENAGRLSVVTGVAASAPVRPHTFAGGNGA